MTVDKQNSNLVADNIINKIDSLTANLVNTKMEYLTISDYIRVCERLRLFYATNLKDFNIED